MRLAVLLTLTALTHSATADEVQAPEFRNVSAWLNSSPLSLKKLKGRVVMVHFWTHGCINCRRNYDAYKRLAKAYSEKKVTIVGIHTPEFASEKKFANIRAALKKNGLTFPVAVDNDFANWKAWGNRYWPAAYLIDKKGVIRYRWVGELKSSRADGEQTLRQKIDTLLAE